MDWLLSEYREKRRAIEGRLREFRDVWRRREPREVFREFVFCLLTPQSRARVCWEAVERMDRSGALWEGSPEEVARDLHGVRFKNHKARYIVEARERFWKDGEFSLVRVLGEMSPQEARDYLVRNVRGMGMKEASHFLRNIGLGENLAILDRHILKNLLRLGVIDELPRSLGRKTYLEIEERMRKFSRKSGIPLSHLDLLFWAREAGEIFK